MPARRPFRFAAGSGGRATSREAWVSYARRLEDLGYSTLVIGHHLTPGSVGPIAALMAAASATTDLRIGTQAIANDFLQPVVLALEATTLDVLSGGRLDLGIGAGWLGTDYQLAGLPFGSPGVRVQRLTEAVQLIKRLFTEDAVSFAGIHYQVDGITIDPKPVQRPHPPIFVGGGGRRMLALAAREANIVGLDWRGIAGGPKDVASISSAGVVEQIGWVRDAAGERFDSIDLHILANYVTVTDAPREAAQIVVDQLAGLPPTMAQNVNTTVDAILDSPHVLMGSVDQIVEMLQRRREELGIAYVTVPPESMEQFAPVVARLAGR